MMKETHKYSTISFRISPREREMIEAKIRASGMRKKDYFVRSCLYNHVCVVGRKELVYMLVEELKSMHADLLKIAGQFEDQSSANSEEVKQDSAEKRITREQAEDIPADKTPEPAGKTPADRASAEHLKSDGMDLLHAILWMLDGAKYLWEEK